MLSSFFSFSTISVSFSFCCKSFIKYSSYVSFLLFSTDSKFVISFVAFDIYFSSSLRCAWFLAISFYKFCFYFSISCKAVLILLISYVSFSSFSLFFAIFFYCINFDFLVYRKDNSTSLILSPICSNSSKVSFCC